MKVYFCLVCVTIILLIRVVCSEYYSAIAHLKHILYTEKNIARELKTNIRKEEERLAILKSIADDYENHSSTAFSNLSFYTENPVNAFLLIKKFTVGWNRTYAILKRSADATVVSNMLLHMKHLPSSVDFNGAAVSLLRLQDTYQLQTSEIASGNIAGSRAAELTAEDCFEIGKIAYSSADFYHAVMWLQESLVRWENEKIKMVSKELILDYLSFSTFKKGNVKHALMLSEDLLAINSFWVTSRCWPHLVLISDFKFRKRYICQISETCYTWTRNFHPPLS